MTIETMFAKHLHPNSRYAKKAQHKAATLLITVLVAVIAATIATFTIKFILSAMSSEYERFNLDSAVSEVKDTRAKVIARLEGDPYYLFNYVLPEESKRTCGVTGNEISAGEVWPSYCGTGWSYAASNSTVKVQLIPYNNLSDTYPVGSIVLRIKYSDKGINYGTEDVLLPGGRARAGIYSGGDLNLANLQGGSYSATLDTNIYSQGNITLSSTPEITGAFIKSEGVISPTPSNSNARYASNTPGSTPKVYDIALLGKVKYTKDSLRGLNNSLYNIACPSDYSVNPVNLALGQGTFVSTLCINPGQSLISSGGTLVTVPATAKATLVLPEASTGLLDIYTSNSEFDPDTTPVNLGSSCSSSCTTDAIAQVTAGTHFGAVNYWTKLGSFRYPASGLVGSTINTQLGLCNATGVSGVGTGFLSTSGSCTIWSGSSDGVEVKTPFTLVVGSSSDPVDLYLGGPVNSVNNKKVGAIVSGDVVLPYWSRPNGSSYLLNLDLSLFVIGRTNTTAFRSYPASNVNSNKNGGTLLNGYYGAINLNLTASGNISSNWKVDTSSITKNNIAPLLSAPNLYWYSDYAKRLDPTTLGNIS